MNGLKNLTWSLRQSHEMFSPLRRGRCRLKSPSICNLYLIHSHSEQPKQAWQFWLYFSNKSIFWKIIEGEIIIGTQTTTLHQIFCEILLHSQVIFKSMRVADDTFYRNSKCEWVKPHLADFLIQKVLVNFRKSTLIHWVLTQYPAFNKL